MDTLKPHKMTYCGVLAVFYSCCFTCVVMLERITGESWSVGGGNWWVVESGARPQAELGWGLFRILRKLFYLTKLRRHTQQIYIVLQEHM